MDKVERTEDIGEKMVNMAILVKYTSLDLIDMWTEKHRRKRNNSEYLTLLSFCYNGGNHSTKQEENLQL